MTPLAPPADFVQQAADLKVEFDPGDLERLGLFLAFMLETNAQRMNLTAITDPAEAWRRHILDALTLVPMLSEFEGAARIIDVGTGGGVPGLPLACVMPHLKFVLLEATGKKCKYLEESAALLKLKNVRVVQNRAEVLATLKGERESYDACIIRAVGALDKIAEWCLPLVKQGGAMLAIKGAKAGEELEAARLLIGLLGARHEQTVATPTGQVVILRKASKTPKDFPRPQEHR